MTSLGPTRHALVSAVVTGTAVLAMLATTVSDAAAQPAPPPPNCTSADLAHVMSGVSAATANYLFTHPEVNDFFTSLKGMPKDEMRAAVTDYGDRNPQARDELRALRQPAADFHARCG